MVDEGTAPPHEGRRRYSVVHFLVALSVLLVALPFLDQFEHGDLVESLLITVVFTSAVFAVGGRVRSLVVAAVLVAPALLAKWIDHVWPESIPASIVLATALLFTGFIVARLFLFIASAPRVDREVLSAAIATFLMMGFLGTVAFELLEVLVPNSFTLPPGSPPGGRLTRVDALFLSFNTLSDGAGTAVPTSRLARTIAALVDMAGLFYMAILISRLVGLYAEEEAA